MDSLELHVSVDYLTKEVRRLQDEITSLRRGLKQQMEKNQKIIQGYRNARREHRRKALMVKVLVDLANVHIDCPVCGGPPFPPGGTSCNDPIHRPVRRLVPDVNWETLYRELKDEINFNDDLQDIRSRLTDTRYP